MRQRLPDLTGQIFFRLTVIKKEVHPSKGGVYYLCKCSCGNEKIILGASIYSKRTTSCGCYGREQTKYINYKHGKWSQYINTAEYRAWQNIKGRCYNEGRECYPDYGGKGIRVSPLWKDNFEQFLSDMGLRPSDKHTIDRFPNTKGDYEPGNCRWATRKEQSRNYVDKNVWIEHDGKRMVQQDWAEELGIHSTSIAYYLKKGKTLAQIIDIFKKK